MQTAEIIKNENQYIRIVLSSLVQVFDWSLSYDNLVLSYSAFRGDYQAPLKVSLLLARIYKREVQVHYI